MEEDAAAAEGPPAAAPDFPTTLEQGWAKGYYITETIPELEPGSGLGGLPLYRDVSREGVCSVSCARAGNGVEAVVVDGGLDTFWQSDGVAPHLLTVQFHARQTLAEVCLYVDYRTDESYCPEHLVLRAGTTTQDLEDVREVRLHEPSGWVRIPVGQRDPAAMAAAAAGGGVAAASGAGLGMGRYLRPWVLQISLLSMHQNGRDGHVRAVRLLSPVVLPGEAAAAAVTAAAAGAAAGGADGTFEAPLSTSSAAAGQGWAEEDNGALADESPAAIFGPPAAAARRRGAGAAGGGGGGGALALADPLFPDFSSAELRRYGDSFR